MGDPVADPAGDRDTVMRPVPGLGRRTAMTRGDAALMATVQDEMRGNEGAILEDADLRSERMHLDQPAPGRVRNAVEVPPTLTMPSREIRRSRRSTDRNGASGNGRKCSRSSANAWLTTRRVVACSRGLATPSSQRRSWSLRSARLRKLRARKKSSRM